MFIPMHDKGHWFLVLRDFGRKVNYICDSMGANQKTLDKVEKQVSKASNNVLIFCLYHLDVLGGTIITT